MKTQSRKKPNNPFKRLLKQRIILCAFQNSPMDQGVLQAMKNRYKRKLRQKVICSQDIDQTQSIKDIVKLHTVKDALYMISDAWYEGSPESNLGLHVTSPKF